MAAVPPPRARRRPRPGSLERPVNGRLYRGTWLLVGLPLLVGAFSVARPQPLPPPALEPSLDGAETAQLARDFLTYPDRFPGTLGAAQASQWLRDQLQAYGLRVRSERFTARVPRLGTVHLQNLLAVVPGHSPQTIVVLAHRDNDGAGPGANDNASGTAVLVELARAYSLHVRPAHTVLFLSTDGGSLGALGAAAFFRTAPERHDVVAAINLDTIGGRGRPRLVIGGDTPRTTSGIMLETAAARIAKQAGRGPARPSVIRQLIDLGLPFSLYEQAPAISRGIPAVTLTTAGDRPPGAGDDALDPTRLGQIGRAAQDLLGTLDQGLEFVQGTSSYVYVGSRVIQGWAIELVLIAMLLPFMAAAVDLFARCRRRHIPLAPALRSYRSRLAFWAWLAVLFEVFDVLGLWPGGAPRPPSVTGAAARHWPAFGLIMLGILGVAGWLIVRDRLIPRRQPADTEVLAGYTVALLCLAALGLLVVATNPFALLFLLPSLHAWLWLPNVREAPAWTRALVIAVGFAGPALLIGSFAFRYGLGWDAPWYLLELRAVGYVPLIAFVLVIPWFAAAAQLAVLAAGRYAPYPERDERTIGPGRRVLRRVLVGKRAPHDASPDLGRALEG
jgi:hypothetical protein